MELLLPVGLLSPVGLLLPVGMLLRVGLLLPIKLPLPTGRCIGAALAQAALQLWQGRFAQL